MLRNVFLSTLSDVILKVTEGENIEVYRILANGLLEYQNRCWFASVKTSNTSIPSVSVDFVRLHRLLEYERGAALGIIR
jgi:hypothetical protein